jgi:hypothetical protein
LLTKPLKLNRVIDLGVHGLVATHGARVVVPLIGCVHHLQGSTSSPEPSPAPRCVHTGARGTASSNVGSNARTPSGRVGQGAACTTRLIGFAIVILYKLVARLVGSALERRERPRLPPPPSSSAEGGEHRCRVRTNFLPTWRWRTICSSGHRPPVRPPGSGRVTRVRGLGHRLGVTSRSDELEVRARPGPSTNSSRCRRSRSG